MSLQNQNKSNTNKIVISKSQICGVLSHSGSKSGSSKYELVFNKEKNTLNILFVNQGFHKKEYPHTNIDDDNFIKLSSMKDWSTTAIHGFIPSLDFGYLMNNLDFEEVEKEFNSFSSNKNIFLKII